MTYNYRILPGPTPLSGNIQLSTSGLVIELIVHESGIPLDISSATAKKMYLKPPTGATLEKTATFTTDGTDGKIRYSTDSSDLSLAGAWQAQGYVAMPSFTGRTTVTDFTVNANI